MPGISLLQLPEQYWPTVNELPRDMQTMADVLEQAFPGQGMHITLVLATGAGGGWYYIRKLDELSRKWRNDTIRAMYDSGKYTGKDLSRIWRLSHRQIQYILAEAGSKFEDNRQLKLFGEKR